MLALLRIGPLTLGLREAQARLPPLSGVSESGAVDVLHQLRQRLGEEGQVGPVSDVVLGPLEQVQQGLQEGAELWRAE